MPTTPQIQAALDELRRRGVDLGNQPAAPTPDEMKTRYASTPQVAPPGPPDPNIPPHLGGGNNPSQVALERNLRVKELQGQIAVQDAVNELKRRGVNLQMRTAPAAEEVIERGAQEAVESARKQGDPEAFKGAWRQLFPGKPLPRKPDGTIDYEGGQDDIDVEVDRKKKLEAAKVGARNIKEVKTTRLNPQTGMEEDILVRVDAVTGEKLGEMILSTSPKALTESQSNAKIYSARMQSNNQTVNALEDKAGFDPTSIGTTVQTFLPNRFRSDDLQSYTAAKRNWIAAVLRKESGAAISPKEYSEANLQYFPQDGDASSVVKQKRQLRELAENQMREAVGPAGGASSAPRAAAAPAAPAALGAAATTAPVPVNSAAEAPSTAKFIRSPSGRVYRNPKYSGQ